MHLRLCAAALLLCAPLWACDPAVDADAGRDARAPVDAPSSASDVPVGEDASVAMPDVPADAPAGCPGLLCEDFEGDITGTWTEEAGYDPENHAVVQTDRVAGGAHALRAHVNPAGGGFAYLTETTTFPALESELWGRTAFYTSIAATSGHSDFIDAVSGDRTVLEVGISNGTWQLTQYPESGENPAGYDTEVPRDRWVCLEWHFQRVSPQIEVFIDGVSVATYARDGLTVPAFTELKLGFGNHGPTEPTNESFFDDVVVGSARVGCAP